MESCLLPSSQFLITPRLSEFINFVTEMTGSALRAGSRRSCQARPGEPCAGASRFGFSGWAWEQTWVSAGLTSLLGSAGPRHPLAQPRPLGKTCCRLS